MHPKIQTLETPRLILRPYTMADIEDAYQMNLDPEVSRHTGDGGVVSREELEYRIVEHVMADYAKHGFGRLTVDLKNGEKNIGFAGLKFLDDYQEVDLGYRFVQRVWGQGIATEAGQACLQYGFETLGLKKIIAFIHPDNIASERVLEKLGFSFDKTVLDAGENWSQFVCFNPNNGQLLS